MKNKKKILFNLIHNNKLNTQCNIQVNKIKNDSKYNIIYVVFGKNYTFKIDRITRNKQYYYGFTYTKVYDIDEVIKEIKNNTLKKYRKQRIDKLYR